MSMSNNKIARLHRNYISAKSCSKLYVTLKSLRESRNRLKLGHMM